MLRAGIARRTLGRFSAAVAARDPFFGSVNLLVPGGDPPVGGCALDVSPMAAASRGVFLNSNTIAVGYITRSTGSPIYTQDGVSGGIAMPFPNLFTFECAFSWPDVNTAQVLFDMRPASVNPGGMVFTVANAGFEFYDVTTTLKSTVTGIFAPNTRHVVAVTRDGTLTTRVLTDGIVRATFADPSNYAAQSALFLLSTSFNTAAAGMGSGVQQIRSTLNVCRYTANYTPVLPFPRF